MILTILAGPSWGARSHSSLVESGRRQEIPQNSSEKTPQAGLLFVKSFRVVDLNGDQDGYPDTNETMDLFLTVRNPHSQAYTNVLITVTTTDPKIDCVMLSSTTISSLPADSDGEAPAPVRLHVHPRAERGSAAVRCDDGSGVGSCSNFVEIPGGCVQDSDCSRTMTQDYSADLLVSITADQVSELPRLHTITLELDVDSSNPSLLTTIDVEGFESGFGSFTMQNIDDNKASDSASNGYRCQYSNPDAVTYDGQDCYMGSASYPQTPVNDWHVHGAGSADGGRAFLGTRSLHYGKHVSGNPGLDTYGIGQMDAVRTKSNSNINLAARVCQDDPSANKRSCNTEADCVTVSGGPCVSASPELSFKHQVSTVDDRRVLGEYGTAVDRAVVHAQVSGSTIWHKIFPFENVYQIQGSASFVDCRFDPTDDGNDEDSLFDPPFISVPTNKNSPIPIGPSSTCYPEFVFSYVGDTDEPFDPANTGGVIGPGLQGTLGSGTWVESRFDLSRYRGRSIKIRFLVTSLKLDDDDLLTWQQATNWNPTSVDDGWYIDDVRITQSMGQSSSTVTIDNADNSSLPGNLDGDARGDACDCAPADGGVFAIPPEVRALKLGGDKVTIMWESALSLAGSDTVHDLVRGALDELPVGAGVTESCVASGIQDAAATDQTNPGLGSGFWYLARARNACGVGTYGFASNGVERMSQACP